jgi:hypothetical protein
MVCATWKSTATMRKRKKLISISRSTKSDADNNGLIGRVVHACKRKLIASKVTRATWVFPSSAEKVKFFFNLWSISSARGLRKPLNLIYWIKCAIKEKILARTGTIQYRERGKHQPQSTHFHEVNESHKIHEMIRKGFLRLCILLHTEEITGQLLRIKK